MRSRRHILALLTLLGWLFALGHMALEHHGVADSGAHHEHLGEVDNDHDADGPAHEGDHHHHDLSALSAARWMKTAEHKALAPVWVPLFDALAERFADLLREGRDDRPLWAREHAQPDARDSGWLLLCQTAHRVRGPSLAV